MTDNTKTNAKMKLKDIPLTNQADVFMLETAKKNWEELVRNGRAQDGGVVRHGVNDFDGLFTAETKGAEEYVLFAVFVPKIRRENQGLEQQTDNIKRAWYDMAKQFVDEFGEDRTPPDIVDCMNGVMDYLGL